MAADNNSLINIGQTLTASWPSFLPPLADPTALNHIWTEILETDGQQLRSNFLFESEIVLSVPGVDAIALTLASSGAGTVVPLEVDLQPALAARLVNVGMTLRLKNDLIKPARPVAGQPGSFELDPTRPFVEIALATVTVAVNGDGDITLSGAGALNLPPCMIGDSGIVIEATGITLHLDSTAPPPGKPAGWKGIHIAAAQLHLPGDLGHTVGNLSLTDGTIGNGGFSGTVATDWTPALAAKIFGMDVTLSHASLTFVQNALTASEIRGSLTLPFFDSPVDVTLAIRLDGGISIALASPNGLAELTKPGILTLKLESLGFAVEHDVFTATMSGTIRPLVPLLGDTAWPEVKVSALSIDSQGHVSLAGGWLDLPDQYHLDFFGFQFEITKLGFGNTEDGGKWIGFSGGLKLIEGLSAGASVEGLRVIWYPDGHTRLTLNGVGVEFEIPGVLSFKGAISYNELPGNVHRFDGSIQLILTTLGLEIDGQIVIGRDAAHGYTFFAIYLGIELPAGIPLWTTGLGLYGLAGLFAIQMEPGKAPDEAWYAIPPSPDWYHRGTVGVTDLTKWTNQDGSMALGAGVTIGTELDNGFTFAGRLLLAIVFPGPILFIEGRANILQERSSLSDEPIFRALAVIDGRAGTFQVGLDAQYKFAGGGEVIDIGGSAEAFFNFNDLSAWHLYLGIKDPTERRIHAQIFHLLEANAYFMLDAHQLAMGAFVGYDRTWQFGPVHVGLQAWIEGDAIISFKPVHFHGELWLHGSAELSVFGFGFSIGADARVSADVFDPFGIEIDLSAHLGLPWPLPDFDVSLSIAWGPEKTPPALPLPLKETAVEHFKVTTSWPLPRGGGQPLLIPSHDDGGYLKDPPANTVETDAPPAFAPTVPLDARPHITFGKPVHDDALVGVNPQPPSPEYFVIGDTSKNEGPVKVRLGLKAIALEKWTGAAWQGVAGRGAGLVSGLADLYGSWAPMPDLAAPTTGAVAQTKLWLWSKNSFDYTRHTTGKWNEWFVSNYPGYPCVPIPDDQEFCCDFQQIPVGTTLTSPWACPDHPQFKLGWVVPPVVTGLRPRSLCWNGRDEAILLLGQDVQSVRLFVTTSGQGERQVQCADFQNRPRSSGPNPRDEQGFLFQVFDSNAIPVQATHIVLRLQAGQVMTGLDVGWKTQITLPFPAVEVDLSFSIGGSQVQCEGLNSAGVSVSSGGTEPGQPSPQTVLLSGLTEQITQVVITAPSNEALLLSICAVGMAGGAVVVGIDESGMETAPVPIVNGEADLDGAGLQAVAVRGQGNGFCLQGFCVVVGLSSDERLQRQEMAQRLIDETALWQQDGVVLEPYTDYRIRIVTTINVKDWQYESDQPFNGVREQTEFALFRTQGPPGVSALSIPQNYPKPDAFDSGLADLTRYVQQTIPPTVPAAGEKPPLPRPVYRAYDVGVDFNENYVDLLYRISRRDLGLYLYDNNNQPARDIFGALLVAANLWGRAETVTLTQTDSDWITVVNASICATISESTLANTKTLGAMGQVLDGDTLYEARLTPLLLHETFAAPFTIGQKAVGNGATLPGPGGGWIVQDMGTIGGPSRWVVGQAGTPPISYVGQQTKIHGGGLLPIAITSIVCPGTVLLRANDPALPANHPDQPGAWTDYRVTAVLRSLDAETFGLVFRWGSAADHYLFAMDRQRRFRRLIRVAGNVWTMLAQDAGQFELDSDYTVTIEAIGNRLRVYIEGALLFDVTDGAHATGGIGLYTWENAGARFADIRVDDFRATAPVVYRFKFTTSQFADFYHQLHSGTGDIWLAPLPDRTGVPAAIEAAVASTTPPPVPTDAETNAYAALANKAVGQKALGQTDTVEITQIMDGTDAIGVLIRTAEPIDWGRATLEVQRAAGAAPGLVPMPDVASATGGVTITDWSTAPPAPPTPIAESVTLLLNEATDLTGYRLEYRTLPSIDAPAQPDGTLLQQEPFLGAHEEDPPLGDVLFAPPLTDLTGFTVVDPPSLLPAPSHWTAAAGEITQTGLTGTLFPPIPFNSLRRPGTLLLAQDTYRDVEFTARLRTDASSGGIGLVFRYTDPSNWYRLSLFPGAPFRSLVKCAGGLCTLLWSDPTPIIVGQEVKVAIFMVGGALRVQIEDVEVAQVMDTSHPAGQVGLYSWRCNNAHFRELQVLDQTRQIGNWSLYDTGALVSSSAWKWEGGALKQTGDLAGAGAATADATRFGAYAITGDATWTDIRITTQIQADAPDASGIAFRWQGVADHYLLILDGRANLQSLVKKVGGVVTLLWQQAGPFAVGTPYNVVVEAIGTRLRASVNGTLLCDLHDQAHPGGKAGVFVCATESVQFGPFTVEVAVPQWMPYYTFAADERLAAGRRVRLFAGQESDLALPPVTGEVRRFQGFLPGDAAGVRLPAEGVDLRLFAPGASGNVVHALRFAPEAAFAAQTASLLRAPDGTGLILLVLDASAPTGSRLPAGIYRLRFTYRRDNTAEEAGSLVLRENGDSSPEIAAITLRG